MDGAENMDNGGNSNAAVNPSADAIAGNKPDRLDTTTKVTGKVLTADDQRRLQEEASRQIAS